MTRSLISTYRIGLAVSAVGLGLLLIAAVMAVHGPADVPFAVALQRSAIPGVAGVLVTVVGFAVMNAGAVASGSGYASLEPGRFPEESIEESARNEILALAERREDNTARCLACGTENREIAKFCDQCGERL